MKKVSLPLLIISLILIASCRQTPEQHIQELIKASVKENLNDPDSYVPVKFSALQKTTKPFECTIAGAKTTDSVFKQLYYMMNGTWKSCDTVPLSEERNCRSKYGHALYNIYAGAKRNYENTPEYYCVITHTYRAKNKFGGVITAEKDFYATPDMLMLDTAIYCDKETSDNAKMLSEKNWKLAFKIPE